MEHLIDIILHFDAYLPVFFAEYGLWLYAVVILIIFCETGLVVTPFLPGDSMLFALGAFAAQGTLNIWLLFLGLFVAAVLGDTVNYSIGRNLGEAILKNPRQKLFKPAHYEKAHAFYERYGGKAIILARFVPIVRTFAPFVAGVAKMHYHKFIAYNVIGGGLWVALFLGLGYALGNVEFVKKHFEIIVPVIIVLSLVPIAWELAAAKLRARKAREGTAASAATESAK